MSTSTSPPDTQRVVDDPVRAALEAFWQSKGWDLDADVDLSPQDEAELRAYVKQAVIEEGRRQGKIDVLEFIGGTATPEQAASIRENLRSRPEMASKLRRMARQLRSLRASTAEDAAWGRAAAERLMDLAAAAADGRRRPAVPVARPRERRPTHRRAAMRSSARSGDSPDDDPPGSSPPRLTLARPRAVYTFGVEARERWGLE